MFLLLIFHPFPSNYDMAVIFILMAIILHWRQMGTLLKAYDLSYILINVVGR